jgi:hypothetical protein
MILQTCSNGQNIQLFLVIVGRIIQKTIGSVHGYVFALVDEDTVLIGANNISLFLFFSLLLL